MLCNNPWDEIRKEFPRFHLLSDDYIEKLMTAPIAEAVQMLAKEVFQGVMKFQIKDGEVVNMEARSIENEVVPLAKLVKLNASHLEVFQELELRIKQAVQRDINQACDNWSLVCDYTVTAAEAYLVADDVHYTEVVESYIKKGDLEATGLSSHIDECIHILTKETQKEQSKRQRLIINSRLVYAFHWRNVVQQLKAVNNINDFR